jgi:hypothetical protein
MGGELQRRNGFRNLADTTQTSAALTGTLTGTTDGAMVDIAAMSTAGGNTYSDAAVNVAITAINLQNKEMQVMINKLVVDVAALTAKINGTA